MPKYLYILIIHILCKKNQHILVCEYQHILVWRYLDGLHKQKISNIHNIFRIIPTFQISFCAKLSQNAPYYFHTTQTSHYLTNPILFHYPPPTHLFPTLYFIYEYTTHTKPMLQSNLNHRKLLKCVNSTTNLLCRNLNYKKGKNVFMPSYLFQTKVVRIFQCY